MGDNSLLTLATWLVFGARNLENTQKCRLGPLRVVFDALVDHVAFEGCTQRENGRGVDLAFSCGAAGRVPRSDGLRRRHRGCCGGISCR